MENEVWKDIPEYEELYQISNLGRIKSKKRLQWNRFAYIEKKERILKKSIDKNGYNIVQLNKNGIGKTYKIHRLVAITFLDNPNNYSCINHKDENKINNNVNNLEWCSISYNNSYGNRLKKVSNKLKKKVIQLDKDNKIIKVWNSAMDICKENGYTSSSISQCCNGKRKQAYGYKWKFFCNIPKED